MRKGLRVVGIIVVSLLIVSGLAPLSSTPVHAAEPNLSTPGFVIDSHMHYRGTDKWEKEFIEVCTKWNAMAILLISMNELERGMAFAKAHPDMVIPYAAIKIDSPTVLDDIRMVKKMGFRGLGELFALNEWDYNHPKYFPIWALADELKLPIAPHTGIHASGMMSRMRPGYLSAICARHPNLVIHAAHFGNPWYDEAGETARRNSNLYFDFTGSSLIKKDSNPGIWKEFLWWTPYLGKAHMPANAVPAFEKIVFATDESPSGFEDNIIRFNKVLDANNIPEDMRKKMYYGTIAKIHNIDVSKHLKK